ITPRRRPNIRSRGPVGPSYGEHGSPRSPEGRRTRWLSPRRPLPSSRPFRPAEHLAGPPSGDPMTPSFDRDAFFARSLLTMSVAELYDCQRWSPWLEMAHAHVIGLQSCLDRVFIVYEPMETA